MQLPVILTPCSVLVSRVVCSMTLRFFSAFCFVFLSFGASAGAYDDYFFAVNQDNDTVVSSLIERGFDPNTVSPSGQHGLLLALRLKSVKVAHVLANAPGTDIETRNGQDESPLMLAALRGYLDLCLLLIGRDADVNKPGWTPLHYAATGGHVPVIKALLDHHAYIDAESPNGSTPLMMAAMYGTLESVQFLLSVGADASVKNELGLTAADFAKAVVRKTATGGSW